LGCDESYYKLFGDFWVGSWAIEGITLFGIFAISIGMTALCNCFFDWSKALSKDVFKTENVLFFTFFVTLMISKVCMYVYDLSCDTLVYCYALDEMGNGIVTWAPETLKNTLNPKAEVKYVELKENKTDKEIKTNKDNKA
jgi:hypothetical protein